MPISMVPDPGSIVRNFQIVNSGGLYDSTTQVLKQGTFLKGRLEGDNCTVCNYANADINVRRGAYSNGLEHGNIFEYVFEQKYWEGLFVENSFITVTRYTQVFAAGVWQSMTEQDTVKVTGTRTYNAAGYLVGFTFVEVA